MRMACRVGGPCVTDGVAGPSEVPTPHCRNQSGPQLTGSCSKSICTDLRFDQEFSIRVVIKLFYFKYFYACAQLSPTLFDPLDCNPPGSSVHEIFQAGVLEWVAISLSRESS